MLRLDGSYGEGGGQILRSALTLSLVTGEPFELVNIRAKRPRPGLRPQHLTCVRAAQKISKAQVVGAEKGSLYLRFVPGQVKAGAYTFDVGTAGATALVFQTVALPLALAGGGRLVLRGGTHVPHAPCYHYLAEVYAPVISLLGYGFDFELRRYGFYPAGGGEMRVEIAPKSSGADSLELLGPYEAREVLVLSAVSEDLPDHIRTRQAKRASDLLRARGFVPEVRLERARSASPGTVVFLRLADGPRRAGFSSLGRKGKPAERVAEEAVFALLDFWDTGAAVDPHLADQLLVPLALEKIPFRFTASRLTRHFFTNLWVIRQFLPDFLPEVQGAEDEPGEVSLS